MPKLNILLITSDQQHWNTLGAGNPQIDTPALDKLATQGTTFTRAYCPNPTCTPTRSSMITGKYPSQHGAYSLGTKLPESETTVGELFSQAGYRTALVGKAHFQPLHSTAEYPSLEAYPTLQDLGFWADFEGPFYGFDHVELARNHTDEAHVGQHYALWMEERGLSNWRDYFLQPTGHVQAQRRKWLIPERFHYNAWIAERSSALIEQYQAADEPFFLWASFFDPHPKYLAPEPWDTMYDPESITVPAAAPGEHNQNPPHFQLTQQPEPDFSAWQEPNGSACHGFHSHLHDRGELMKDIACYYGMVSCMDKYIGQIIDKLDALGLAENTLVVFTSDHGHYFGQHGLIAKGAFHYEDGLRVPMIARLPGRIPANANSDSLQSLVDYAPTFLAVCGLDVPEEMTGLDQFAVWGGDESRARSSVIIENRHQPTTLHLKTFVGQRYKLTRYFGRDYGEIFDLRDDPGELRNLWADESLRAELTEAMLRAELQKEVVARSAPLGTPNKSGGRSTLVRASSPSPACWGKGPGDRVYLPAMNIKSCNWRGIQLNFDPAQDIFELFDLTADPHKQRNLWHEEASADMRADMVWALLQSRWGLEPLWMPRVAGA
ncbi:MAG: sulfatase-like hydrolase/transferase [Chloroflexi bacterium]|nr:sulfatase-like hydrolase/transferase [Chloroflexota bacterium]